MQQTGIALNEPLQVEDAEIEIIIDSIDCSWFSWKIPDFPVMSVDFTKVKGKINGKHINGLIKRGIGASPGKVKCTSHCQIIVDGVEYTVLWEFSKCKVIQNN